MASAFNPWVSRYARTGSPKSLDHLERIAHELAVPVQYGGGLRSLPAVRDALRAGAERVILGTAAFNDMDFLDDVLGAFRERVVVSVDTRGGNISTAGWQQTTQMPAESVIERLQHRGVRSFVYTNVDRDGMLEGPDVEPMHKKALHVLEAAGDTAAALYSNPEAFDHYEAVPQMVAEEIRAKYA